MIMASPSGWAAAQQIKDSCAGPPV